MNTSARAALEAILDGPAAMLALLRAWGRPLPERLVDRYGPELAANPATYKLEGGGAWDAQYTYPDRWLVLHAVIDAILTLREEAAP